MQRGERRLYSPGQLDLAVGAGEAAALVGPNGAGKTSLLRAIAGFLRPTSGEIRFDGADGPLEADEARRADTHLLGHQDGLKSGRTARDELIFQACWTGGERGRGAGGRRDPRRHPWAIEAWPCACSRPASGGAWRWRG